MTTLKEDYIHLGQALERLREVLSEPMDERRFIVDATLQRFEFCFELFWKNFKNLASKDGREVLSPIKAIEIATELKWIQDAMVWFEMLNDRNTMTRAYKIQTADKIYFNVKNYLPIFQRAYQYLKPIVEKSSP